MSDRKLGEGGFGTVNLIEHNGMKLARKEIDISKHSIAEVKEEIKILKRLRDRRILILKDYEINEKENKCYIYTEYLRKGDLNNLIEKKLEKKEDFSSEVYSQYLL